MLRIKVRRFAALVDAETLSELVAVDKEFALVKIDVETEDTVKFVEVRL
jgi:hypothetical protein